MSDEREFYYLQEQDAAAADNSDRIADALERIAAALEEDGDTEEPSGYEAALMASAMRRFAS